MSEVIKDELPNQKFAVLSGPTLAKEVLMGYPTAASVASDDIETAKAVQKMLTVKDKFRLYTNTDMIGVELGGSLKNVIAIAAGFLDEMNFGDNSKGALLARGMAEIARVAVQLGANPSTMWGLSGMGDLIATCSSHLSRNNTVGRMLAQGKKIDDILACDRRCKEILQQLIARAADSEYFECLCSIKGVGANLAARILAEVGPSHNPALKWLA